MSSVDELLHRFFGPFTLTQGFGVPNAGTPGHELHTGIDIGEPTGTAIRPTERGKVKRVYRDSIGGLQEDVQVSGGYDEIFAHLSDVTAKIGQDVSPNDVIGHSGATGEVTGAHLHFEVRDPSNRAIDPLPFLEHEATQGNDCPPGWSKNMFGVCVPFADGGGIFNNGPVDQGVKRVGDVVGTDIPSAIGAAVENAKSGIVKFSIAAAIVGGLAFVGYRGIKRLG